MTTTTTALPVHGVAGALGVDSVDGRRIVPEGFTVRQGPLPLMAVGDWRPEGAEGHEEARVVGQLDRVTVADGLVQVDGTADGVPAGEYPCGMDLHQVATVLQTAEGEPVTDADIAAVLGGAEWPDLVQLVTAGELIAVTLYLPGSGGMPAFPQARLRVGL